MDAFGTSPLTKKMYVFNMCLLYSVFATESFEYCTVDEIIVKLIEKLIFSREMHDGLLEKSFIFIFYIQNICIRLVKQFGNKTVNYLTYLFIFQFDCMIS